MSSDGLLMLRLICKDGTMEAATATSTWNSAETPFGTFLLMTM